MKRQVNVAWDTVADAEIEDIMSDPLVNRSAVARAAMQEYARNHKSDK